MNLTLVLWGCGAAALSGVPGLLMDRRRGIGQTLATILMALGAAAGLGGAAGVLLSGEVLDGEGAWFLPWGNNSLRLDPLAAFFLVPVFLIPALGSLYGQEYWRQSEHPGSGRKLRFFYGLLASSMVLVVLARDSVLFLIAWEIMALSAYFLATTEDEDSSTCRAGWIYLVATHLGTLCLISLFAFLRGKTGTTGLVPIAGEGISPAETSAVFVLMLLGFGFKAGLMPLHVWLPGAHASAPSHVSAVMSGVMLKMGIYGIVRMTGLLPRLEPWHGGLLLAAGTVSAVLGVALALAQSDLKRLLAYSSIENVGIIAMGLGLALLGRAFDRPDWMALGLCGALLHVWNHSLFKSLLFFGAGVVIHAAHTRDVNQMGGLAGKMPRVAALFVIGAGAICALPGLNGFVSEWLIYSGLMRTLGAGPGASGTALPLAALCVPALALTGALAVGCFVGLLGSTFLGASRSGKESQAREPGRCIRAPMVLLALGCAAVGLFPMPFLGLLQGVILHWARWPAGAPPGLGDLAPVGWIGLFAGAIALLALLFAAGYRRLRRRERVERSVTWDCGYAAPGARMQYTPSSFTAWIADLFGWALWPRVHRTQVSGLFPKSAAFKRGQPDPLLDRLLLPLLHGAARLLPRLRLLQQGSIQVYMLYSLAAVLALFWWGRNGR